MTCQPEPVPAWLEPLACLALACPGAAPFLRSLIAYRVLVSPAPALKSFQQHSKVNCKTLPEPSSAQKSVSIVYWALPTCRVWGVTTGRTCMMGVKGTAVPSGDWQRVLVTNECARYLNHPPPGQESQVSIRGLFKPSILPFQSAGSHTDRLCFKMSWRWNITWKSPWFWQNWNK